MIGQYLKIWNLRVQKNLNIEKIIFKVVQMKSLAMHITNKKLSFYTFTVQNIFMEHDLNILMIFGIKEKMIILSHTMYCCLLLQIYLCCLRLLLCSWVIYLSKWECQNISVVLSCHCSSSEPNYDDFRCGETRKCELTSVKSKLPSLRCNSTWHVYASIVPPLMSFQSGRDAEEAKRISCRYAFYRKHLWVSFSPFRLEPWTRDTLISSLMRWAKESSSICHVAIIA